MAAGLTLVCPIRGRLKAKARSKDGLTPSEERFRVEAIRHLIACGYPKENIRVEAVLKRFGNAGRNSFRCDLVVLDVPVHSIPDAVDDILAHAVVLGEVKRDNAEARNAKDYQVRPMLDFARRDDCVALYWDDVEQRVFWTRRSKGIKSAHEGPLADLPGFGEKPGAVHLTFATIDPDKPLLAVFERIEDILHSSSISPSKRFAIMLQLLLAKLYDEHQHEPTPDEALTLQDFIALDVDAATALTAVNTLLGKAVQHYTAFLPEPVAATLSIAPVTLLEVMRVLAPIKIVSMEQNVIQDFYMYFAKHIYKWDLAQYFTPTTVTDFIVDILNPQWGERINDPACGSADFLTAAFRRGHGQGWRDYASSIWGSDISPEAVQVAVLNMILNGDGKTNIRLEDSLAEVWSNAGSYDVVICNPPFGSKIVERNASTLANFDLAHVWEQADNGIWNATAALLDKQETGFLFAETCVRLLRPGGRLALVVPNGYLGNRSARFLILREWLLRHCKVSVIVGLPRFTFKSSGADVSASVLFCEKRDEPLAQAKDSAEYEFAVEIIDRVGWITGNKRADLVYRRDLADGTLLLDDNGQPMLESDFGSAIHALRSSDAVMDFPWLVAGPATQEHDDPDAGWTVSISAITADPFLTLDPKRHSRKHNQVREQIIAKPHFRLGDVVDFLPERMSADDKRVSGVASEVYKYVEIADVEVGAYRWTLRRGWDLPQRGRHFAEMGDIYVGAIWGSARKWFMVGRAVDGLVVTNGMHRIRVKSSKEDLLLDLVAGLCSEAYGVQMRAMARGSDGLAEIAPEDAAEVVLPKISNETVRAELEPFISQLTSGFTTVEAKVSSLMQAGRLPIPVPPKRPDHTSIV